MHHDFHVPMEHGTIRTKSEGEDTLRFTLTFPTWRSNPSSTSVPVFHARGEIYEAFSSSSPRIKADMIGYPRLSLARNERCTRPGSGYRKVASSSSSSVQANAAEPLSPCTMTWYMTRAAIIIVEWHSKPSSDVPCDWPRGVEEGSEPLWPGQGLVIGTVHPHNLAPR